MTPRAAGRICRRCGQNPAFRGQLLVLGLQEFSQRTGARIQIAGNHDGTVLTDQCRHLPGLDRDAFYKLDDAHRQITSNVFDVVRAQVPKIKLDDVFEKKDEIATIVKSELEQVMADFGYGILNALVTDIDPDAKVKEAMNDINAAQRARVAATERGEAERPARLGGRKPFFSCVTRRSFWNVGGVLCGPGRRLVPGYSMGEIVKKLVEGVHKRGGPLRLIYGSHGILSSQIREQREQLK